MYSTLTIPDAVDCHCAFMSTPCPLALQILIQQNLVMGVGVGGQCFVLQERGVWGVVKQVVK